MGAKIKTINQTELAALLTVEGPQITRLEIETQLCLADMRRVRRQIDATPAPEKRARSGAALQAIRAGVDIEAKRAAIWNRATLAQRRIACMCAGLEKERGNDALAKFDTFERTRIWTALDDLVDGLVQVQSCMSTVNYR